MDDAGKTPLQPKRTRVLTQQLAEVTSPAPPTTSAVATGQGDLSGFADQGREAPELVRSVRLLPRHSWHLLVCLKSRLALRSVLVGVTLALIAFNLWVGWHMLGSSVSRVDVFSPGGPPPVAGFRPQAQPWRPQGPYLVGHIILTNTSGHRTWTGYVMLLGRDDVSCADSPYDGSAWRLDLRPGDVVSVVCAVPVQPDVHAVPAGEFAGYWPDELGSPDAALLQIVTPRNFTVATISARVPTQPMVLVG